MTEVINTEETVETEAVETEEASKVVNADGTVKLDVTADLNDARDLILKDVLETQIPIYNEVVNLVNDYRKATNIDGSVNEFIDESDDADIVSMREKLAQVKATQKKLQEKLAEIALEKMKADLSSDFDLDAAKREYQDKTVAIRDDYATYRKMFEMYGHVKFISGGESIVDGKTVKRNSRWEAVTPAGEAFLALGSFPRLTAGSSTSTPNSEGKHARKWAMSTGWKTEDGKEVVARGPLPSGLLDAWKAAGSPESE